MFPMCRSLHLEGGDLWLELGSHCHFPHNIPQCDLGDLWGSMWTISHKGLLRNPLRHLVINLQYYICNSSTCQSHRKRPMFFPTSVFPKAAHNKWVDQSWVKWQQHSKVISLNSDLNGYRVGGSSVSSGNTCMNHASRSLKNIQHTVPTQETVIYRQAVDSLLPLRY